MSSVTIGVDLAKRLFSVCEVDAAGQVLRRKDMGRKAFALWLAQVPVGTVVAMEACGGAHHWARRCLAHGLQPRLMAAQFVSPFRKNAAAKNDRNDAEAIATAARQGNMRFVPVKSVDQQARLAWHRVREGYKTEALALSNRIRGVLAEFGVVVPLGDRPLRTLLADLDVTRSCLQSSRNCCAISPRIGLKSVRTWRPATTASPNMPRRTCVASGSAHWSVLAC